MCVSTLLNGPVYTFDTVSSTMDCASNILDSNTVNGTGVIAGHQTQGRGNHGKAWEDVSGENLLTTILVDGRRLRRYPSTGYGHCALRAALAVFRALNDYGTESAPITIKWPNDVFVRDKKIAGILIEYKKDWVAVGIGVNIGRQTHLVEREKPATSIAYEFGVIPPILELFHKIRSSLEETVYAESWTAALEPYMWRLHKKIVVDLSQSRYIEGVHRGITEEGELLIECHQKIHKIHSGSIRI